MSTAYSIGQMNQLADALEAAGFTPDDVTKLRSYSPLSNFKSVLCGKAEIVAKKHIIGCDADLFIPEGWSVEEHRKGGQLEFDPSKISLYLSDKQKTDKYNKGHELRKLLAGQPVLNANVLDYLLAHPEIILEEWKSKCVFFWGTIYRDSDGDLYVRYLNWNDDQWHWNYYWLDLDFHDHDPAALLGK